MVIKTGRLLLRPLALSDAEALLSIISDETVQSMTVGFPKKPTIETARTIILTRENQAKSSTALHLAIEYDGSLAGLVGLNAIDRRSDKAAVDYVIAAQLRRKGIVTQALRAFIPAAAEKYTLHRISASCFADNIPSRRVLEKTGFSLEGIFVHEIKKNGIYRDVAHYGFII